MINQNESSLPAISVIVPVYNVELYLSECIESILAQTFRDFELILVNDGSTDGSGDICDRYAEIDRRVRAFHKPNGGVSSARNFGVNKCNLTGGGYLTFVDSDDFLPPTALADLWKPVEAHPDVDVVCGHINVNGKLWFDHRHLPTFIDDRKFLYRQYFKQIMPGYIPGKMVRKRLYAELHLHFEEGITACEDTLWGHMLYKHCERLAYTDKVVYSYRMNEASITHRKDLTQNYLSIVDTALVAARAYQPHLAHMEQMFLLNQLSYAQYERCEGRLNEPVVKQHLNRLYQTLKDINLPWQIKLLAWRLTLPRHRATNTVISFLSRIAAWTIYHGA